MKMHFSDAEGRVLHGLIEDASGDIVVRLDAAGFIAHASENASELGMDLSTLLLMPHIADFAEPDYAPEVTNYVSGVFAGQVESRWIEFPVLTCRGDHEDEADCAPARCRCWYALNLRLVEPDDGAPQGALGLLRSVQHKHALGREVSAQTLTDPLTGLANRRAFCASLQRTIIEGHERAMVVFALDRMRAIFMQYGQQTADEIQWGFARFLETMTRPGKELAQLEGERFGVILPGMTIRDARQWAQDVLQTFAGLASKSSARTPELSASAGLARVENTVDWTLRQAELGLVMARAGGGMQVGVCQQPPRNLASGELVERAMDQAVQRAERREG